MVTKQDVHELRTEHLEAVSQASIVLTHNPLQASQKLWNLVSKTLFGPISKVIFSNLRMMSTFTKRESIYVLIDNLGLLPCLEILLPSGVSCSTSFPSKGPLVATIVMPERSTAK